MTALNLNPQICLELETHPERFLVQIRMCNPEDTVEDGPLVSAVTWRNAFHESFGLFEPTLDYFLVSGWTYSFFWGMSDEDRSFMLHQICGIAEAQPDVVRKRVKKLKLKGWSDFPDAYNSAPFMIRLFRKHVQV
jgi:hypothetical protein